jgi:RNA polymerase sigma-70 factor (ECF subfamily)
MAPAADEPDGGVTPGPRRAVDSEAELLARIAERDYDAFELLYRRYARAVYGLALRRLHDRGRAEAATQFAFVAVWRAAAGYAPAHGSGVSWLYGVMRGAIADRATSAERDADPTADDDWLAFAVHTAVADLPVEERVPLELAYWEGRRPGEIAELLGLPLGTVETRTRLALAHLAVRLHRLR